MADSQQIGGPILGAIEAGGTKFNCAVGAIDGRIVAETRIPTTTPDETIARSIAFFKAALSDRKLDALGIASFGPVQLRRDASDWGHILKTPKPGWSFTDLAGPFKREFDVPVGFDTDVNGAVLGEQKYGAGLGLQNLAYVTVGTGIGAGLILDGKLLHGHGHPEIGHFKPRRPALDQDFAGCCPFHGDCLEGLASGQAIMQRLGGPSNSSPIDHPIWDIEADYLAQLCALLVLTGSPQRIILGGGVMDAEGLLLKIRARLLDYVSDYPIGIAAEIASGQLLAKPGLGGRSGIVGALCLAISVL